MIDISKSEKELLQTMVNNEFDRIVSPYDNSRYLLLIELSEKLYLDNGFIQRLKTNLDIIK